MLVSSLTSSSSDTASLTADSSGSVSSASATMSSKAFPTTTSTPSAKLVSRFLQFLKAAQPIVPSLLCSEMTTLSRLKQSAKAEDAMVSTESGRITFVIVLFPAKAFFAISVIPSGTVTTESSPLYFLRISPSTSKMGVSSTTWFSTKGSSAASSSAIGSPVEGSSVAGSSSTASSTTPSKALSATSLTFSAKDTSSFLSFLKAADAILSSLLCSPMITFSSLAQFSKADVPIFSTESGRITFTRIMFSAKAFSPISLIPSGTVTTSSSP